MKNKQIYNNRSYSPIRITEDGDIELVLSKYAENIPISELQLLNNCNVLSDTIPRDTNFFYSLWFSDPQTEKLLFSETGFGELKDKKGRTFLQREYIFTEFHPPKIVFEQAI